MVMIAVPDASASIELGDISMVIHEHLNFFEQTSLRNTVTSAGFRVVALEKGGYGGVLYCAAVVDEAQAPPPPTGVAPFEAFTARVSEGERRFAAFLAEADSAGGAPGFYVPLRALPYLGSVGRHENIRFFDDDPGIHGRYFDGFAVPVENFADLQVNPPSTIFVASTSFGRQLRERINSEVASPPRVVTLDELLR
jgi:hypothetical protein